MGFFRGVGKVLQGKTRVQRAIKRSNNRRRRTVGKSISGNTKAARARRKRLAARTGGGWRW